jgi:hypothetical protein
MTLFLVGSKESVTNFEKSSQYFFLYFFEQVSENFPSVRHGAMNVFTLLAC